MKLNFKNIIRLITLVPLSFYLLFCCYYFITFDNTYTDCGTVISKPSDEISIKHGTRTELYLNVQFEKSGFKSIECGPTTYFSKKVGDNVCFELKHNGESIYMLSYIIGLFTIAIIIIILIFKFIYYISPDSWK